MQGETVKCFTVCSRSIMADAQLQEKDIVDESNVDTEELPSVCDSGSDSSILQKHGSVKPVMDKTVRLRKNIESEAEEDLLIEEYDSS
jgi:hypothetical protein